MTNTIASETTRTTLPVSAIRVGPRVRKEMGDLDALAVNIDELGLLQPIVVNQEGTLIAGERRLQAVSLLGWQTVPVHIVPLDRIVRGEFAENEFRKQWTPSEQVAIKRALDADARQAAQRRRARPGQVRSAKFADQAATGEARHQVAKAVGLSHETLRKAEAVVAAADADPVMFDWIREEMDRTGKVDAAYRVVRAQSQAMSGLSSDDRARVYAQAVTLTPRTQVKQVTVDHLYRARAQVVAPTGGIGGDTVPPTADGIVYDEAGITLWCSDARMIVPTLPADAVIITDPPYNIAFNYGDDYEDRLAADAYDDLLRTTLRPPCVVIHRPEGICRVSRLFGLDPTRSVAWVYNGVFDRQWRQIAWFGLKPDLTGVGDWWNLQPLNDKGSEKTAHPCQTPFEVIDRVIAVTPNVSVLVDPFAGSGTTLVAAKSRSLRAIGIEQSARYCRIAAQRLREAHGGE